MSCLMTEGHQHHETRNYHLKLCLAVQCTVETAELPVQPVMSASVQLRLKSRPARMHTLCGDVWGGTFSFSCLRLQLQDTC